MRKKELYRQVIAYFEQAMPVAETELHYNDPFQLLVAVILSAQCTDKRVNLITPPLFRDYPTHARSDGFRHARSDLRIHSQRELSQQQGTPPCRRGADVSARLRRAGARYVGRTGEAPRCRTEDGKRSPKRGVP